MGRTQVRGRLAVALAALVVLVAACAEDEGPGAASAASGADAAATGPTSPTESTGAAGTTPAEDDAGSGRYDYGTGGAGDDGAEAGTDVTLIADNFVFDPAEVELAAGAEITVENTNGGTPHTFTVEGTDIDLELEPGEVETATADLDAGTYTFVCRFHPQMTGTLTIT